MLDVKKDGERAIIDVRGNISRGEHPRNELIDYINKAPNGTIFEIHVPFRAEPLIAAISSLGLTVTVNELASNHFQLIAK